MVLNSDIPLLENECVGIRNSPQKKWLTSQEFVQRSIVKTKDLTFDCMRHLDFLAFYDKFGAKADFSSTLYWRYYISFGHPPELAQHRCDRFGKLFEKFKSEELDRDVGRIKVTEDGIRLDGSHRSAIAYYRGIEEIEVDCFLWGWIYKLVDPGNMKLEAETKRKLQKEYLGRKVYHRSDNQFLGEVVFVEARPTKPATSRLSWLFTRYLEPWLAVAKGTDPVMILPLKELVVQ